MIVVALEWLTYGIGRLAASARRRGIHLVVLTADPSAYGAELVEAERSGAAIVVVLDTSDTAAVREHLRSIRDLGGLISTTDTWSLTAVQLAEELGLPSQNPAGVRTARDKVELRNRLHEAGLSTSPGFRIDPSSISHDDFRAVPLPFIAKDSAGTGSRNVWTALDAGDVGAIVDAVRRAELRGSLAVEPYFLGPLYSIEAISSAGETRALGVSSRIMPPPPCFREDGNAFPVLLPAPLRETVEHWIVEVLQAVGLTDGFTHTEFIITRGGIEVVEVNPRLGGGLIGEMIERSLGIDLSEAFLDLALGLRPRLMEATLTPCTALAEVDLYAPSAGVFEGIDGTSLLPLHPGEPELHRSKAPGSRVVSTEDHRGGVGSVLASGATTELALSNALAAAGKLRVRMATASP